MKRFFFLLSALSLATMLIAQSGKCGPNLYWSLDKNSRTVKITGTGPMYDYEDHEDVSKHAPWHAYRDYVYYFVFEGTPSKIGSTAFWGLTNCYSITIPSSVTSINRSFYRSPIKVINLPASISFIHEGEFAFNFDLTTINVDISNPYYSSVDGVLFNKNKTILVHYPNKKSDVSYSIPNTVKRIMCFRNEYLQTLTIPNSVTSIEDGDLTAKYGCENLTTVYYERGFNPLLVTNGKQPSRPIRFIMLESKSTNQHNSSSTSQSAKERLESLKTLYNSGLISKEEYDRKRNEIISTL